MLVSDVIDVEASLSLANSQDQPPPSFFLRGFSAKGVGVAPFAVFANGAGGSRYPGGGLLDLLGQKASPACVAILKRFSCSSFSLGSICVRGLDTASPLL